jgi:hypothetical protein
MYRSTRAMYETRIPREKCPSSIQVLRYDPDSSDPFSEKSELLLTRDRLDNIVFAFSNRSELKTLLKCGPKRLDPIIEYLNNALCIRLVYHTSKYIYSVLVTKKDDLHHFIRSRVIWHLLYHALLFEEKEGIYFTALLIMVKCCCSAVFNIVSEVGEKTVFSEIDTLLDPLGLIDSVENPDGYDVRDLWTVFQRKRFRVHCDLHQMLMDEEFENEEDKKYAQLMVSPDENVKEMLELLSSEAWGDLEEKEAVSGPIENVASHFAVRRMLERDLREVQKDVPGPAPKWVRKRGKAGKAHGNILLRDMQTGRSRRTSAPLFEIPDGV